MTEYSGLENIEKPLENTIITIGNFDGVHKGHQELLGLAIKKAYETGCTPIACTFDPHPVKYMNPENHPPVITPHEQKKELIKKYGIQNILTIKFSEKFANISAHDFIEGILSNKLGARYVVVGRDFKFGKNRTGNIETLREYGKKYGFELILPDWIKFDDQRISSTLIRQAVSQGEMEKARSMLGRYYQIKGKVVHGRKRGDKIGFPTANLDLVDELCPKMGVYSVIAELNEKKYSGVANIGYSPTFDDHKFTVEVHFLDFKGDLYEKDIKVNFIKRLRGEIKFSGIDELSKQITKDVQNTKKILESINM